MPTDLTATSGLGPTNPTPPIPTSRALVPVAPVSPRPVSSPTGSPLDRSGLDLLDVFGEPDTLVARGATVRVALDAGLEEARGALVRNLPGDALAALDRIWDGARHTEEGWYLRGGSLTLLGLAGEADRVVGDAVESQPASSALRFLQSIARLSLADLAGARAALGAAMQLRPSDPLLLVQQALVVARQGDRTSAQGLMARAATLAPDHPAIAYGRAALRMALADATRAATGNRWGQSSAHVVLAEVRPATTDNVRVRTDRGTVIDAYPATPRATPAVAAHARSAAASSASPRASTGAPAGAPVGAPVGASTGASGGASPGASTGASSLASDGAQVHGAESASDDTSRAALPDVATDALQKLGARIAVIPRRDAAAETRMLLRAFSSGGTLSSCVTPERAHAVRTVLAAFASALGGSAEEYTPGPLLNVTSILVREVVAALRSNRLDVAAQVVLRTRAVMSEPLSACLRAMVSGATLELTPPAPRATPAQGARVPGEHPGGELGDPGWADESAASAETQPSGRAAASLARPMPTPVRGGENDRTPLVALRLGLALLPDERAQALAFATGHANRSNADHGDFQSAQSLRDISGMSPNIAALPYDSASAPGWGATMAGLLTSKSVMRTGQQARSLAIACVAFAFAAFALGHPAIGFALAGGALWLALRRGHSTSARHGHGSARDRGPDDRPGR